MAATEGVRLLEQSLPSLVSALEAQIRLLSESVSAQSVFDKKSMDNLLATTKAIASMRELIAQSGLHESDEQAAGEKLRSIVNELEEWIDQLANQRAEQIVAQRPDGETIEATTEQGTAAAASTSTSAPAPRLEDLVADGRQGLRENPRRQ